MRPRRSLFGPVAFIALVLLWCRCTTQPGEPESVDPVFEATAGAKTAVLGDINGDGWEDLASVSDESQPVQVHLQDPITGIFTTYTIAGGAPIARASDIELADMNADGKLDIILLINDTAFIPPENAQKESSFAILFQGDDPTDPATWTQIPTAGGPPPANMSLPANDTGATDLAVADLDGVNGPDIVILSNEVESTVAYLYANPGPAAATDQTAWSSAVIERDVSDLGKCGIADLDRDGDLDVILSAPLAKSFNVRWLQNPLVEQMTQDPDPVPTFMPEVVDPVFEATAGARADVMGDIDNDGLTDIASISFESQPVQLHLRNRTTGKFDTLSIAGGAPIGRAVDLDLADFNADGKLDIAVLVNDTSYVAPEPYVKRGALVLLIQGSNPRNPSSWTQVDVVHQLDGSWDCLSTVCIGEATEPECADCHMVFLNNATGCVDLAVGDFNNDSLPDVVLTSNEYIKKGQWNYAYMFLNPGVANVTDPASWDRQVIERDAPDMARIAATDLDADGDDDVIMTVPTAISLNVRWLRNANDGANWTAVFVGQQDGGGDFLALADIDADGDTDVGAASVKDGLAQWFRNPGPAALGPDSAQVPWEVFNIGQIGGTISQFQFADLDDDGYLDAFVSSSEWGIGFRRQDNLEHSWDSFTIFQAYPPAEVGAVAFSDFDGDGLLDFVAPFDRDGLLNDEFILYKSYSASLWHRRLVGHQDGGADHIDVGDIDGDGNPDVAAAYAAAGLVQWFQNPGPQRLLPTAPQVPWVVYNVAELRQVNINGDDIDIEINQIQLVDLDTDTQLECFLTGSGTAFQLERGINVEDLWTATPIFTTDPLAEIGRVAFLDLLGDARLDYIAPLDRDGLTNDQVIVFMGTTP